MFKNIKMRYLIEFLLIVVLNKGLDGISRGEVVSF